MLRKLGVLVPSMVLVSSLAMVLVPATQAAAGNGDVPNTTINGGGPSMGNTPAGDTTPGGPGTTYTPNPTNDLWRTWSGEYLPIYCRITKPDGRKPISITFHYILVVGPQDVGSSQMIEVDGKRYQLEYGNKQCNYGPEAVDTPAVCAWQVTVEGSGPNESPAFFPKQGKWSDFHDSDQTSADLCDNTARLNVNKRITELGRYRMDTVLTTINCMRTDFPDSPQAPVIKANSCGNTNVESSVNKVSQWCGGSEPDWDTPHTFTMDECAGAIALEVQCQEPQVKLGVLSKPSYGVLDDGKHHIATWGEPTLTGEPFAGGGITKLSTTMTVKRGGPLPSTPYRVGQLQESPRQPYQGVPPLGENDGILSTMDLQWYAPSMPDRAWVLERVLTVRANFTIMMTQYDFIDQTTDTAHWETTEVPTLVSSTKECTSSLRVTVKRARNTR